jgi:hypothetical protein
MAAFFMRCFSRFLLLLLLTFVGLNCNKPEPIPSYLYIKSFVMNVKSDGSEGSAASKITDAWVYVDENLIGVFETPAKIPVLYWGSHKIRIKAGIKSNGQSASRAPYPFYRDFEITRNLTEGEITEIEPQTSYAGFARFVWLENFETLDFSLEKSGKGQIIPEKSTQAFEGNYAAHATLTAGTNAFECASRLSFTLPKSGTQVWLEVNFKTDFPIIVGLYAGTGLDMLQTGLVNLAPTAGWNKIYIDLTEGVSSATNLQNFKVFFGCVRNAEESQSTHQFFVDNIKLVTI